LSENGKGGRIENARLEIARVGKADVKFSTGIATMVSRNALEDCTEMCKRNMTCNLIGIAKLST